MKPFNLVMASPVAGSLMNRPISVVARIPHRDDTFYQHGGEGELPRVAHAQANGIDEEGIQSHARRQSKGFLGIEGHHQRTDDSSQGRCSEHATAGHTWQRAEDCRIDGQDIGHRQESGDARHNLCADIVLLCVEAESFLKNRFHNVFFSIYNFSPQLEQ